MNKPQLPVKAKQLFSNDYEISYDVNSKGRRQKPLEQRPVDIDSSFVATRFLARGTTDTDVERFAPRYLRSQEVQISLE
jgi:hypothetical protein